MAQSAWLKRLIYALPPSSLRGQRVAVTDRGVLVTGGENVDVIPLGQDAAGRLLLGAPTRHAARTLAHRYRTEIERACTRLLGHPCTIHPVDPDGWGVASGASEQ